MSETAQRQCDHSVQVMATHVMTTNGCCPICDATQLTRLQRLNAALMERLTLIKDRINDMPLRPRNDFESGEKAGIQWASDQAEDAIANVDS